MNENTRKWIRKHKKKLKHEYAARALVKEFEDFNLCKEVLKNKQSVKVQHSIFGTTISIITKDTKRYSFGFSKKLALKLLKEAGVK